MDTDKPKPLAKIPKCHPDQFKALALHVLAEATPEELYTTFGVLGFGLLFDMVRRRKGAA